MFDPAFINNIKPTDIIYIQNFVPFDGIALGAIVGNTKNKVRYYKTIVKLQDNFHALIMEPNIYDNSNRLVIDRLKYIFDLRPMHVFLSRIPMNIRHVSDDVEIVECDKLDYIFTCPDIELVYLNNNSKVESIDNKNKLIKFNQFKLLVNSLELLEDDIFKKEVIKIILFKFIIGNNECHPHSIIVKYDKYNEQFIPLSCIENHICKQNKVDWIGIYGDILFNNDDLITEAKSEVLQNIDYDCIRGIILQSGNPETALAHHRSRKALSVLPTVFFEFVDTRIEILSTLSNGELLEEYLLI